MWRGVWVRSGSLPRLRSDIPFVTMLGMPVPGSKQSVVVPGALGLLLTLSCQANGPAPPAQPALGPGGSAYVHQDVQLHSINEDSAQGVRIYLPALPIPTQPAPLVVFMHGYQAMDTWYYDKWMLHLARRGNVVVFPMFMERQSVPTSFLPNAQHGLDAALVALEQQGVTVDRGRVLFVGHSGGGPLAVNLAVLAARGQLQVKPHAMLLMAPGRCMFCSQLVSPGIHMERVEDLPKDMKLVVLEYDEDWVVGGDLAHHIYNRAPMAAADKVLLLARTDRHGNPTLEAQHRTPAASDRAQQGDFGTDAMDYFGSWKLADALLTCAQDGTDCDVALGRGAAQLHMGFWEDGTPVRGMLAQ